LKCYGIDISEGMIAIAKKKVPDAEIKLGSYYEIPYPEGIFDHVVATNALSGDSIDARRVLFEMHRVCSSGGWIYIAEWPKAQKVSFAERLVVWFASLADDAPKDYLEIFRELGYVAEVDVLGKRYHVYGIKKL